MLILTSLFRAPLSSLHILSPLLVFLLVFMTYFIDVLGTTLVHVLISFFFVAIPDGIY